MRPPVSIVFIASPSLYLVCDGNTSREIQNRGGIVVQQLISQSHRVKYTYLNCVMILGLEGKRISTRRRMTDPVAGGPVDCIDPSIAFRADFNGTLHR